MSNSDEKEKLFHELKQHGIFSEDDDINDFSDCLLDSILKHKHLYEELGK